jgi:HPt (histidine-containing phosphotransfer) domain-containing protein
VNDGQHGSGGVDEVLDSRVIQELRELGGEDDPGLLAELIQMFLEDAPGRMKEIEKALASGDIKSLEHAAHTLKSSSANIGARGLSSICKRMEELARAKSTEGMPELLSASLEKYRDVATALRSLGA